MKITRHHTKKICELVVKLRAMASDAEYDDDAAAVMSNAAFYLTELAVKHEWPDAQSLIEARDG